MDITRKIAEESYERYFFIRVNLGYSDSAVAQKAKISKATFSNWKNGVSMPKVETLYKVAQVCGCKVTDIIRGADENTKDSTCAG